MFILRIIHEERKSTNLPFEQLIENFELGRAYSKLEKGITSEFEQVMKDEFPEHVIDGVKAIICGQNGDKYFVEYNSELRHKSYFIMTETGQTFERIF